MKKSKLLKFIKRHRHIITSNAIIIIAYVAVNSEFLNILTVCSLSICSYLLGYWNAIETQSIQVIKTSYTPEEVAKNLNELGKKPFTKDEINKINKPLILSTENNISCPNCENPCYHQWVDGSYSCEDCGCTWK